MIWLTAKNVAIFLGLATTAFCIATIVLAVENTSLENDLEDARQKLEMLTETTSTSTTTTTAASPTPDPNNSSSSESTTASTGGELSTDDTSISGNPSSPTSPLPSTDDSSSSSTDTTSAAVSPTIPSTINPNYPTLPTGLPDPAEIVYRLPEHLRPIKYRIYVHPDLERRTCNGTVSIQFQAENATNLIVLHAKDIEVEAISILNMMAKMRIAISKYYTDDSRELLIIELKELLSIAKAYAVSISYSCNLSGLSGAYASSYQNADGGERWIATTKFEPTFARLAFPCFDEPSLKAQFTLTIVRPTGDGYHALSNMNVENEEANGDVTEVTFAESVPMSTYLVSFIVSDFANKSKTISGVLASASEFELRAFAPSEKISKVEYALDVGATITEYYIDYFNVAYPLPKLDLVAIPDFVSGAMENWGLVTFRETALLYDEKTASSANKQRVAQVVAHELAHMWFGNLVTMKWWNDLWLNEGFATFLQHKGMNKVHPEWDMKTQFLTEVLHSVMNLDATLAAHPIIQSVESPAQITEIFDSITYSKGASLVRMLENLVGEEHFRSATNRYLRMNTFGSATTDDFLTAIEEENLDFDTKLIMQTWTVQSGLPVVEVTADGNNYKLTQKRFLSNKDDYAATQEPSNFNYRWSIPITYITSEDNSVKSAIFNYNDNELTLSVPSAVKWIKINKDQVGYYRVNYPAEMWQALSEALKTSRSEFSVADRAHLINDVFSLANAAQLNFSYALDLTTYLEAELDYVPWSVANAQFLNIGRLVYYTSVYGNYAEHMRKLLTPIVEKLTFVVDADHLNNRLRSTVLNTACSFGQETALQEAVKLFNNWLSNPDERPDPNIRGIVYSYGLAQVGNEAVWDKVWKIYLAETDVQEKVRLMEALAQVQVPWILSRYIDLAWDEKNVRGQDYISCLQNIAANRVGQSLVWDYVRENWPKLINRFGINERNLGKMIPAITSRFTTKTKLEEMEAFFAKYPEAGAGTAARKEALEKVKNNIKWLEQNEHQVSDWLAKQNSETPTNRIH